MYRESDYDIPLTNDVPALADSMTKYVHREVTFQIGGHVERIEERLDTQSSDINALQQDSAKNARILKNETVVAVEHNFNQKVDKLEEEYTKKHEKLKEDMQGIVDQTVNSAIDDLRKTLQAQSTQATQPPTRLPQAAVQAHEKRTDDRGPQHPKPQAQRKSQLPPDSKEPSTQSRLQIRPREGSSNKDLSTQSRLPKPSLPMRILSSGSDSSTQRRSPSLPIRPKGLNQETTLMRGSTQRRSPSQPIRPKGLNQETALRNHPETLDVAMFKQYLAHENLHLKICTILPPIQAACRAYLACKTSQSKDRKHHLAGWRQYLMNQPASLISLQAAVRGWSAVLRTALTCRSKARKQRQLAEWRQYLIAGPALLISLQTTIRGWPGSLIFLQAVLWTALMCQSLGRKQHQLAQWRQHPVAQSALIPLQTAIRGRLARFANDGRRHQLGDLCRYLVDNPASLVSLQATLRTALMRQSMDRKQRQLTQWRQYLIAQPGFLTSFQTAIHGWLARSASERKLGDWRRYSVRLDFLVSFQAVLRTALTRRRFQRLRLKFIPVHLFHFSAIIQEALRGNQVGQFTSLLFLLFPYVERYLRMRAEAYLWCFIIAVWGLKSYIQVSICHIWSSICVWGFYCPTAPMMDIFRKPYFGRTTPSRLSLGGFAIIFTLFWFTLWYQTKSRRRAARFSLGHLPRYTYLTLAPELIDVSLSSYSKRLSPIDPTPINVAIAGRRKVDGGFEEMAKVMMRPCGLWFCYRDTLFGTGLRTPCDIQELEFRKPLDGGAWKTQEVVTRYNIPEPEVAEPATVYNTVIYSPLRASVAEGRPTPSISSRFFDDTTPKILQKYIYLAASVVALLLAAYCLSKLFSAVREDVLSLAAEYSFWLKLFAEVMADWCNIFVEKITWKTTAFLLVILSAAPFLVAQ
ncbi:uncharacterized protein LACBIDRAFT_328905 [Laccaria bicolor S238N-H82]|uniref:Predicted protein n=1 Tax=Laccaria bicolor (strain S238N-H82 / ATCC MYA-4686) TaxID=486041 RepID=B0DGD5_LACBS|nr:uncharacterized protein LACBIDRAFT_328905 [Laccaria bicolor S238N-H82]EDR06130.1 predicted protein [Laccaria bicolor S238N-H82]|eukprot:XP_001882991.1 predicted protein [Laccaria bicolor S238N-H82]